MNTYEAKQEARRERYEALAAKNAEQSSTLYKSGMDALSQIPFGQPILVGHHSERSDRAYRGRACGKIDKSFELSEKANYYEQRAASVGKAGISSDDPDAVIKLEEKLAKLEGQREQYKEFNKTARKNKTDQLPKYVLQNLAGNIRNVKLRIENLKSTANIEAKPDVIEDGYIVRENQDENRLQIIFEEIPNPDTRRELKRYGFRWSPMNKAWQRQLTQNARYSLHNLQMRLAESEVKQ